MGTKSYTLLGWLVWQIASRVAKRKIRQNQVKLGAAGAVLAVLVIGLIASKSGTDE